MKIVKREHKYELRLQLVKSSYAIGLKPTARLFKCSIWTVRKWRRRYEKVGITGLTEISRRPHRMPNKCSEEFEEYIINLRKQTRNKYGSRKLIERFGITEQGKGCIQRIVKEHGLGRKRQKRHKKRHFLWSTKRLYKAFEKIQVDVKVLTDIATYWPQFLNNRKDYPRYEVTARDVKTGATFVALMKRNTQENTGAFMEMLGEHLKAKGFDLSRITIQTDNGSEFNGGGKKHTGLTHFESIVVEKLGMQLRHIPPAAPTFNSDVETFHRLVEDEFYSIELYRDLADLLRKEYTYMVDFNYLRKNRNKDNQTPWEILKQEYPDTPKSALIFPVVLIDEGKPDLLTLQYHKRYISQNIGYLFNPS
ncbi:MAG: helix-turn-helix domain-containing protein, partial [Candidatus Margulisbacteria bacterium]|nr:helix-turn-helix domain-containing protein [Candidatus Margulisiibacteriota bacterium]